MALPSMIYRANLTLSDVDRGIYETLQTTIARHPSETEERLVARLLAYALFYGDGLTFTKGVGAGDEPDIWLKGPDGRTLLWIEVGLPEPERLTKASRHSERVALLASGRTWPLWEQQHLSKLKKIANISVITLDNNFVSSLASKLERSINWTVTITDNNLYINAGNETFETVIHEQCSSAMR
jgi:uncharacterized protein YaeQ